MSAEYSPQLEPSQKADWFGGFLEGAGSMGYYYRPNGNRAYPQIQYKSLDVDPLLFLQNVFGGSVSTLERSNHWITNGPLAHDILVAIAPYAPSKKHLSALAAMWNDYTIDEKIAEIQKIRELDTPFPHKDEYVPLVRNKQFLAGVFDARAALTIAGKLRLSCPNQPLLEALQELYGGFIYQAIETGQTFEVNGKVGKTKRPSYSWTAPLRGGKKLAQDIHDYVMLKNEILQQILQREIQDPPDEAIMISPQTAVRLAHLIKEKGGGMGFSTSANARGKQFSFPYIRISSDDELFLASLAHEFGGPYRYSEKKSTGEWVTKGYNAAYLGAALRKYASLLPENICSAVSFFEQWLGADTTEEKVAVAKSYHERKSTS